MGKNKDTFFDKQQTGGRPLLVLNQAGIELVQALGRLQCTNEEIVNAYDNTINYTSYFLNDAIKILNNNKENFNVALIYVSDHGQSLGENGIYLHGMPYKFSPKEQRHIPFFMWFSDDFKREFNVNEQCLKNKQNQELYHDNIFHSVLGLFNIKTKYYTRINIVRQQTKFINLMFI